MNVDDKDTRSHAHRQAAATRAAAAPSIQLLSRPESPHLAAFPPDDRYGPAGHVRNMSGYDANQPAPALPAGAVGAPIQLSTVEELCAVVAQHHHSLKRKRRQVIVRGTRALLTQLMSCPGSTWEQRWLASGWNAAPRTWMDQADLPNYERWSPTLLGMNALLQVRALRPSYSWLLESRTKVFTARFIDVNGGDAINELRKLPAYQTALLGHQRDAEAGLSRVMIRTGKTIEQITGDDLLYYADVVKTSGRQRREHLLWELLVQLGPLAAEASTMRAAWSAKGNTRQHCTATLVDRYGIPASGVRDLLVDYLQEIRPGMDYGSLEGLAYRIARLFWWQVLQINPNQADLRLSSEVVTAWRARLAMTTDGRERRDVYSVLFAIRGFYRDLAEWSHDDPVRWGVWVAPCPVPRTLSRAAAKNKHRQRSEMQSRTRMLTPLLPVLLAAVNDQKRRSAMLLERAQACADGAAFEVDGSVFVRDAPPVRQAVNERTYVWVRLADGQPRPHWIRGEAQRINATAVDENGFWCWAVVETLRHNGIRIEELLELTQLSLRHYTASTTGTLVPLLHIVPSKTDRERLVPMTPELVQVLLAVMRRAKGGHDHVPLSIRYDINEKVHGQPFPHLFSRQLGTRQEVLSAHFIRSTLNHVAMVAGLTDAGQPIRFTPHDFRRLFATETVNNGLPLHIAAALLGHLNLDTTRGYTAVFPEHLITAHQAFIERRRQLRPIGENRIAEDDEWSDFENHFVLRRVALGECHRPYGTPCVHEHAPLTELTGLTAWRDAA